MDFNNDKENLNVYIVFNVFWISQDIASWQAGKDQLASWPVSYSDLSESRLSSTHADRKLEMSSAKRFWSKGWPEQTSNPGQCSKTLFGKAKGVSWRMECLWRSQGQVPSDCRPRGLNPNILVQDVKRMDTAVKSHCFWYQTSHVTCHVTCVMCNVSSVTCQVSGLIIIFFSYTVVRIVVGGSVINGAYPV